MKKEEGKIATKSLNTKNVKTMTNHTKGTDNKNKYDQATTGTAFLNKGRGVDFSRTGITLQVWGVLSTVFYVNDILK
jgi:hypothetical protein